MPSQCLAQPAAVGEGWDYLCVLILLIRLIACLLCLLILRKCCSLLFVHTLMHRPALTPYTDSVTWHRALASET